MNMRNNLDNIRRFEELMGRVNRPGIHELMNFIKNTSDFYTAPASTQYHLSCEGGLLQHSLNVYDCLIAKKNNPVYKAWEKREKLLVVYAQSNYPQHPAIAEYLEEQKKKEAADLEKKKQEDAKKEQQRAEAKKKKEEEKLKEQKLSKIKKIIWGTWGGLSLLFLILAEEWWAYILIILAVIAVAAAIFFVTEFFLD